jgi:hypothetical protein
MPASRWQARFSHEARGLHRNWLRTYTRWIVVGPAHRRFSVYVLRRDHWHVLFCPKKMADGERGRSFFFSFEFFCKLNLILKKPLISRGTGGLHKGEDLSPSWIVLQVNSLKTLFFFFLIKEKRSKKSKDWRWIMHIQTQLPTACNKWAWRMGGGCECGEVKMWLNPLLLLFNLRWRILKSNENSLVKKTEQDKMGGTIWCFHITS